jgi:hypothetical protein
MLKLLTSPRARIAALLVAIVVSLPAPVDAQVPPPRPPGGPPPGAQRGRPPAPPPLRIFLDCWECDLDYLRRNVRFVDYVRDRSVADLHVLVTTQSTGGGGSSWVVKFIGLGRFAGLDRTFSFTTNQIATSDERRREFARIFRLGLVGYAADTAPSPQLEVTFRRPPPVPGGPATTARDPWRRWVFRTSANASLSGEASSEYKSYRLNASATRTTDAWKINVSSSKSYNESLFKLGDGREITSITESSSVNGLVVKSLTGKWSWGTRGSFSTSSFSNTERAVGGSTGLEYDFFPYSEANRRSLTVLYSVGVNDYRYRELTIFDKLSEAVPSHSIGMSLGLRQPWGSMGSSANFSQHLNHRDRFRASVYGNADVRVFKGFSFYMYASYSKIKDQIALRKGESTPEEILLRLTQQATNYSYNYSIGFSYSFGSIFTSIVNPRFGGGNVFFF